MIDVTVTNSSKSKGLTCPKRYYWRYERGFASDEPSFVMDVGTFFHAGLDHLLAKSGRGVMSEESLEEAKHDVLKISSVEPEQHDAMIMARWLLDRYFEYWSKQPQQWVEVLHTEVTLGFAPTPTTAIMGKLDGLVRDASDRVWILEHKTTYSVDQDYLGKVALDGQITLYMALVERVLGIKPSGVIYNVICRPRKYRRNDEDMTGYLGRCVEDYRITPRNYMDRQKAFRNPRDIDEMIDECVRFAEEVRRWRSNDVWLRNTSICFVRGRTCPYVSLCAHGESPATLLHFKSVDSHRELDLSSAILKSPLCVKNDKLAYEASSQKKGVNS